MKIESKIINIYLTTWEMRIFCKLHMDFLQLPNYFLSRRIQDCSVSAMLSRSAKCLENGPIVSQIDNFYQIGGPLFSESLENLRQLLIDVFRNCPEKVSLTCRVLQWIVQKQTFFMLSINSLTYVNTDLSLS